MSSATLSTAPSPEPGAPCAASVLQLVALGKEYRAAASRCVALDTVSLRVHAGECVAITGDAHRGRIGPRSLLWCVAGLVRPTCGAVHWFASGLRCGAPPLRLVALEAPLPKRWCVEDVVQGAVAPGTRQSVADRLVAEAIGDCGLDARLLVHAAPPTERWRLHLACAAASGATWLLLDLPPACAAASPVHDVVAARAALSIVAKNAQRRGGAVIAAADGDGPLDDALPGARYHAVAAGVLRTADGERDARRVAEP